ncbi:unnamed protein product [Paramecium sonneborni]|uniref:Uncharacterized protein n=1 Tax=Paramecium sonneborni TaxID=65129 RepID=A0A8S1QMH4_9CILI|nr:unnamed protein product [Paramecium sonneborni]
MNNFLDAYNYIFINKTRLNFYYPLSPFPISLYHLSNTLRISIIRIQHILSHSKFLIIKMKFKLVFNKEIHIVSYCQT